MPNFNEDSNKINRFEYGPFSRLVVQDAIIIIAIYAGPIDPSCSEDKIKSLEDIAERFPVCVAKKKGTFSRINTFVNEMQMVDREKALEIAMEALSPELRKTAFELAVEFVVKGNTLSDQNTKNLEELAIKLSIDPHYAATVIERLTNPSLSHSVKQS